MAEGRERGQEKKMSPAGVGPLPYRQCAFAFSFGCQREGLVLLGLHGLGERRGELNSQLQDQEDCPVGKVLV